MAATLEAVAGQIGGRGGDGNRLRRGPIDAGGGEGGAGGGDGRLWRASTMDGGAE